MEFTLLWAALTGVTMMWFGTRIWRENTSDGAFDKLIGAAVVGLFTGRIVAMIIQGVSPLSNPLDVIIVRGGVDTVAATIGAVGALAWSTRHDPHSLDALAPAALLGLAGWHAGCLWRGACLGAASDFPWAWSGPTSEITRHPVELYAAVGFAASAFIISRLTWRPIWRSGWAFALAGAVRLVTEPLRPSLTGGPVGWYAAAVGIGLLAAATGQWLRDRGLRPTPT